MFKEFLHNSLVKDLKVLKRLAGKIPLDQMSYRPKDNLRSIEELLQYLSFSATAILQYWLENPEGAEFRAFFTEVSAASKSIAPESYPEVFENQVQLVNKLFEKITEEDLTQKEVKHPAGLTYKLGEGIIETSIKWLSAYKMQLFLYIKMTTDQELTTPDLWRKYED